MNEAQLARLEAVKIYVQVNDVFPDTHGEFLAIHILAEYIRNDKIPNEVELG